MTAKVSRPAPALVTLSLSDPSNGQAETLTCTPEHPLYVSGKGWAEAGDLGVGTSIVTRAGPPVVVEGVSWRRDETGGHPFTVYNLTVEGDHTYFAGTLDGGAWAHNEDPCNILFTQDSIGKTFTHGDWAGKSLDEAIAEAQSLGRLPDGLEIGVTQVVNDLVTLNNRSLYVAQQANLLSVRVRDAGISGWNTAKKLMGDLGFPLPFGSQPVVRP